MMIQQLRDLLPFRLPREMQIPRDPADSFRDQSETAHCPRHLPVLEEYQTSDRLLIKHNYRFTVDESASGQIS